MQYCWLEIRRICALTAVLACIAWIVGDRAGHAKGPQSQETSSAEESSVLEKRNEQERTGAPTAKQATEHPDGNDLWKKWGIPPRVMTGEERRRDGLIIEQLEPRRSKELLLELAGEKKIDKARPILDILGVDSLPSQPKPPAARLSDRSLRSVEGFVPASAVEDRPRGLNPDWVVYRHLNREGRVRVTLYYDDSPARAFCRFVSNPGFSASLVLLLPTCRIKNGPGQFCWIGWGRTNNDRTLYYPSDEKVLFLRDGVAVLVLAEDTGGSASAMELARKIDGLLVKQASPGDGGPPKQPAPEKSDQKR